MKVKNLAEWRRIVLERDNYTCQICGSKDNLIADHIKSKTSHLELALETDNGRTLCCLCHGKYGDKVYKAHHVTTRTNNFQPLSLEDNLELGLCIVAGKIRKLAKERSIVLSEFLKNSVFTISFDTNKNILQLEIPVESVAEQPPANVRVEGS